jgi:hypothetical protein
MTNCLFESVRLASAALRLSGRELLFGEANRLVAGNYPTFRLRRQEIRSFPMAVTLRSQRPCARFCSRRERRIRSPVLNTTLKGLWDRKFQ